MGFFNEPKEENIFKQPHFTKREMWHNLTLDDKINIVHDVLVIKRPLHEVAKKYHRSSGYLCNFLKKFRKKRSLLREMMDQRDQLVIKEEVVQEVIQELLDEDTFIENTQQVVEEVLNRHQMVVKPEYVR